MPERNPHRIDPTAAPSSPAPAPSSPPPTPLWERPWVRRLVLVLGGAALGALCQVLPPPVRVVCTAVAGAMSTLELPSSASSDGGVP